MSMSNIPLHEDCMARFNEMQIKKMHGYMIMSIHNKKKVCVDELGNGFAPNCTQAENEKVFDEVRSKLLVKREGEAGPDPKYLVFDFRYDTKDGSRTGLVFINWCSDMCGIHKKTIHGSTSQSIIQAMQGLRTDIQANDDDELTYQSILEKLEKK